MREAKQPFRFTEEQRKTNLLSCWKRGKEIEKANAYLDAIEPRIQTWLELKKDPSYSLSHSDIRKACQEFYSKLSDITEFMDGEKESLYALIGITETSEEKQAIRDAARQLRESSAMLGAAALNAAESIGKVSSGPDISMESLLVMQLAVLYRGIFQKEPSTTPGSNFQCFVSALSKILRRNLGPKALKTGVGGYACNFVPPAGATWSKDKDL